MFDKFKEYWDTLNIRQKNALYSRYGGSSFIYKKDSYDRYEEPELRFPTAFATLDPEKYKEEMAAIELAHSDDRYDGAMNFDKIMYITNFMCKNTNFISKEQYEIELNNYLEKACGKLNFNRYSKIFTEEQFMTFLKAFLVEHANNLGSMASIQFSLLMSDDPKSFDYTRIGDCNWKYLFYTQDQLKAEVIKDPDNLRKIEDVFCRGGNTELDQMYTNMYNSITEGSFNYKDETEKALRDALIIQKYKYAPLHDFIQEILTIDIQFGKLLVPLLKAANRSEYHIKTSVNDVVNSKKYVRDWIRISGIDNKEIAEDTYLGRELTDIEKDEYRYSKTIRQMCYLARCCMLRRIPTSKMSFVGNGLAIVQLFDYDWDKIWDSMYGHLTNEDV